MAREAELTVGAGDCPRCFGAEVIDCPKCNAESVYYCEVCCGVEGCDCVLCRGLGLRFCLKCSMGECSCPDCSADMTGRGALAYDYARLLEEVNVARTLGRLQYLSEIIDIDNEDEVPWTCDMESRLKIERAWESRWADIEQGK